MATADPMVLCFPVLEKVDLAHWKTSFLIVTLAFIAYTALFFIFLVSHISVTFRSVLEPRERAIWCAFLVRYVCIPTVLSAAVWCLLIDDTLQKDMANANTPTSYIAIYFYLGFYIFESGVFLYYRFSDAVTAHHVATVITYLLVIYYGKAHYFAVLGFLFDVGALFKYVNWVLAKAKMDHLLIWKFNQFICVYMYHCRTTLEMYYFFLLFKHWDYLTTELPVLIILMILIEVGLFFFILTPYWTHGNTRILIKKLMHTSAKENTTPSASSHNKQD